MNFFQATSEPGVPRIKLEHGQRITCLDPDSVLVLHVITYFDTPRRLPLTGHGVARRTDSSESW
jgi:hypothetical protein